MYSPELQSKLAIFRQKVTDKTITDEELKEAADLLRQERRNAVTAAGKKRSPTRQVRDGDDILAELEGL